MPAAQPTRTYADYLRLEEGSDIRHEYCQGVVLAMAGGTGAHARLKTNLTVALGIALKGRPCQPRDVDQRVRIAASDLSTYPDLSVVCGRRIPADDGTWARRGHGPSGQIPLESIEVTLSMEELYEGWAEEREIDAGRGSAQAEDA